MLPLPTDADRAGLMQRIARLRVYMQAAIEDALKAGVTQEQVDMCKNNDTETNAWVPVLTGDLDSYWVYLSNDERLGCCYICGYIGAEQQTNCPKCQADLKPGDGDFFSCTLRDIYLAYPYVRSAE